MAISQGITLLDSIYINDSFPTPGGWVFLDTTIVRVTPFKGLKAFVADQSAKIRQQLGGFGIDCGPSATVETEAGTVDFSIFPNPASDEITVASPGRPLENVVIFNQIGQSVFARKCPDLERLTIDLTGFPNGAFLVKTGQNEVKKVVVLR